MKLYHVFDADYEHDAYPDVSVISAFDAPQAGKEWAKQKWSRYDYPDELECIVIAQETGQKYHVVINVEAEPVFYAAVRERK